MKTTTKKEKLLNWLSNSYFFNKSVQNPEFLVFFRVTIGVLLCAHFIAILADFHLLYGMQSLIPTDIQTAYSDHNFISYDSIIEGLQVVFGNENTAILIFKILYISLCTFISIGLFSRYSAILLLVLQVSLAKSGYYFSYGVDFFSSMSLMYLILFPSDQHFSVRNLWKSYIKKTDLTPYRRLFQIHLSIAYFVSGFEKIIGYNWRNGESIWKAVHLPNFSNDFNINFNFLGDYPIVVIMIGWTTVLIELLYPIFINIKKTRQVWLWMTVSMHLGIALTLNLYFFSAVMICWNLTNYYFNDIKEEKYEVAIC